MAPENAGGEQQHTDILQENLENVHITSEEPAMPMPTSVPFDSLKMFGSEFDREEQELIMKKEKDEMARLDKLRQKRIDEEEKKKEKINRGTDEFAKWNAYDH